MKLRTLIIAIVAGLFAATAGLAVVLRQETIKVDAAVTINAPADVVWTYLVTPGHRMDWMRWLDDAIDLTRRGIRPGSRTVLFFVRDGLTFEVDEEIQVADAPHKLSVKRVGGSATADVVYTLSVAENGATHLSAAVEQTATTLWGPYLAYFLEREQQDVLTGDLRSLKTAVELAIRQGLLDEPDGGLLPGLDLSPPSY